MKQRFFFLSFANLFFSKMYFINSLKEWTESVSSDDLDSAKTVPAVATLTTVQCTLTKALWPFVKTSIENKIVYFQPWDRFRKIFQIFWRYWMTYIWATVQSNLKHCQNTWNLLMFADMQPLSSITDNTGRLCLWAKSQSVWLCPGVIFTAPATIINITVTW